MVAWYSPRVGAARLPAGRVSFARSYRTRPSCSAFPMTDPASCPYSSMSSGCTTKMSVIGIDEFHGNRSRMRAPVVVVLQSAFTMRKSKSLSGVISPRAPDPKSTIRSGSAVSIMLCTISCRNRSFGSTALLRLSQPAGPSVHSFCLRLLCGASDKRGYVDPASPLKTPVFAGLTAPTCSHGRGRGRDHAVCRIRGRNQPPVHENSARTPQPSGSRDDEPDWC